LDADRNAAVIATATKVLTPITSLTEQTGATITWKRSRGPLSGLSQTGYGVPFTKNQPGIMSHTPMSLPNSKMGYTETKMETNYGGGTVPASNEPSDYNDSTRDRMK
jgi:hypothetical protein